MRLSDLIRVHGGNPNTLGADPILMIEGDDGVPRPVTAADSGLMYDGQQSVACLTMTAADEDVEG